MANKYVIIRMILIFTSLGMFSQVKAQSIYGDFPYYQSFRTTIQPTEIEKVTPQGGKTNAATFTVNGLRLTPATQQQFGAVFIKDKQFQSIQGIRIEFEYAIYDGDGADGMSVFFFDANVTTPTIGAPGCGIGYTYNRTNNQSQNIGYRASGLSGAYLGIALDSYGNFKSRRWQGDARVNGIPNISESLGNRYTSNVTLRGAKGGSAQLSDFPYDGMGDGYNGYPVLISQPTLSNNQGWILDNTGGTYSSINTYQGNFNLRGGSLSAYRKAIVEIFPFTGGDGFWVTVKIQHEQATTTVIKDYPYKQTVIYAENAYTSTGDNNQTNPSSSSKATILDATIPEYLRIGFAASTGGVTDIHLLRELRITLPGSAEAYDDYTSTPKGIPVAIDALANDIGYTGIISQNMVGSASYLAPSTFRFCNEFGVNIGVADAGGTSYSTTEGTWRFDFVTGNLTFTPVGSFIGEASVKYNIKANGIPYNDDAYRSLPATVTVEVVPPKAIISNRMITPVITPR